MEPPGTAPGSDPLITSAFMSIVPKDRIYIGEDICGCKPPKRGIMAIFPTFHAGFVRLAAINQIASTNSIPPKVSALAKGGLSSRTDTNRPSAAPA